MKKSFTKIFILLLISSITYAQNSELDVIKTYLGNQGYDKEDVKDLKIQSQSFSKSMQATVMYVVQAYKGVAIRNSVGTFALKNGKVVSFQGTYVQDVASKITAERAVIASDGAIKSAVRALKLESVNSLNPIAEKSSNGVFIYKSNVSQEDIPVQLVYELTENRLVLSWDLHIYPQDGQHWYSVRINAENGELVSQNDWVVHCNFGTHSKDHMNHKHTSLLESKPAATSVVMNPTYNVFPLPAESPNHGGRQLVSGVEDAVASPFGWHDTDGVAGADFTTTTGNNVIATEDLDGNNGFGNQADGGASLLFDYPLDPSATVSTYQEASLTNLFYMSNVTHDVWYQYGFDEASGNFQANNYGRGGIGGDEVIADGQDGSAFNNANFASPPEGSNPRMQMFLWFPLNSEVKFEINNTTLAGEYRVINNNFSPGKVNPPDEPNPLVADLVLATDDNPNPDENDICSALTNAADLNGKIAVVRRGECNFTEKVITSQQAGAVAVLVVNNQLGDVTMGGENAAITIPAVSINSEDGEAIIAQMATETVSANLGFIGEVAPEDLVVSADGSFDNGIVIHEYGHGISIRLAGGPQNSGCLSNAEQMGEGWSDWFALMMTIEPGDQGTDTRGIGTYAQGQPTTGGGIRPFPYSTDTNINPVTYGDTNNQSSFSQPHGIGSIWASILWDMTWAFIDRDGFDPDIYNGTGGNNLAMQLVIDGLKLQSCSPGFVNGRDGILAAADLYENAQDNKCLIWEVFANRGLGWSASQGLSALRNDQVEAFDYPPASEIECAGLGVDDFNAGIFTIEPNPSAGVFNIRVAESIGKSAIKIFDVNGRLVHQEEAFVDNIHTVNTSLRSGIYLLRIEAENGTAITTTKIVVK